jgi:hypothetical protein
MLAISACAHDSSTAPNAAPTQPASTSSAASISRTLQAPRAVNPLLRKAPLVVSETVSATIGVLGGTIVLPKSGLTVVVPPLAVSSPIKFTVTAKTGKRASYQFEPHGQRFLVPLVVTQNLLLMQTTPTLLSGGLSLGYVPDDTQDTTVSELSDISVDLLKMTAVSPVWHFSGYMIATGRSDQ